jgi:adenosine deaminase
MQELFTLEQAQKLPKIIHHEHYDCSPRKTHVLRVGTEKNLKEIPVRFRRAWRAAGDNLLLQDLAATAFQLWLMDQARRSLTNYLTILWKVVLPTLQTQEHIYTTAKERIDDAVADGIIFLKLRFAPQLHRREGLTLQQVIDPLQQAVSEAPFPVRLVVCALRHENGRLGWHLANSVIRNPLITTFDLAGDESKYPGVLPWWARQARRVKAAGKALSCHIGEAVAITDADHDALDAIGCDELGHAIKGDPRNKKCTVCVSSNILTQVVDSIEEHPIDEMDRAGDDVSVDLDGTLLTGTTASHEYCLINKTFGWGRERFLHCNLNGLAYVPVDERTKRELERKLYEGYR